MRITGLQKKLFLNARSDSQLISHECWTSLERGRTVGTGNGNVSTVSYCQRPMGWIYHKHPAEGNEPDKKTSSQDTLTYNLRPVIRDLSCTDIPSKHQPATCVTETLFSDGKFTVTSKRTQATLKVCIDVELKAPQGGGWSASCSG